MISSDVFERNSFLIEKRELPQMVQLIFFVPPVKNNIPVITSRQDVMSDNNPVWDVMPNHHVIYMFQCYSLRNVSSNSTGKEEEQNRCVSV